MYDIIIGLLALLIIILSLVEIRELNRLRRENREMTLYIDNLEKPKKRRVQYRTYIATKDTTCLTKGKKYKAKVVDGKVLLWYTGGYFGNFGTKNIKRIK